MRQTCEVIALVEMLATPIESLALTCESSLPSSSTVGSLLLRELISHGESGVSSMVSVTVTT